MITESALIGFKDFFDIQSQDWDDELKNSISHAHEISRMQGQVGARRGITDVLSECVKCAMGTYGRVRSELLQWLESKGEKLELDDLNELHKSIENYAEKRFSSIIEVFLEQPSISLGNDPGNASQEAFGSIKAECARIAAAESVKNRRWLRIRLLPTHSINPQIKSPPTIKEKGYVFVAMPMAGNNPEYEDVLGSIKRSALECGLRAERVDELQSNERITDNLLNCILKAEYVVADLTNLRPNVFYEAGFAFGTGIVPIYIARNGTNLEFDLKDYPVIFFANCSELERKLKARFKVLVIS